MLLDATESQLVLVDYQERLMPAIFEGQAALANAIRLAQIARLVDVPVWGTEQNPTRLGSNDAQLRALCQRTLSKMHFSAAADGLGAWLRPPAKPQGGNARSLPKHLQKAREQEQAIQQMALEAYLVLGCRGWSRVDVMVRSSDSQPFLLEINTSPGMTSHSLVPMSAKADGISYPDLCLQILASASLDGSKAKQA